MMESQQTGHDVSGPVKVIIVGAGSRSMNYASFSKKHPELMQIVGVVDPDSLRRDNAVRQYDLPDSMVFTKVEELAAQPKLADAVINGTLDAQHVSTSVPLLRKGYDLLLEKPIGISEQEVLELYEAAEAHGRKVMICHVLRYAPFYVELQKALSEGLSGILSTSRPKRMWITTTWPPPSSAASSRIGNEGLLFSDAKMLP
ncbi:Gfo/Idh/MocA family oxidoreductase [Paenibacillus sp. CC-CFT747]|nr:Gfo/Idh/MocA family oxidoreductase [Paenibacillus sp. CC-CFT747]